MELSKQRFSDYLFETFFGSKFDSYNRLYSFIYAYELIEFFHNINNSIDIITNIFGECTLKDIENIIAIECTSLFSMEDITEEKIHKLAYRYMGEVISGIDLGEVDD